MTRRAPKGEPSTFTSSHIKQRLPVIVKRGTRLEGSGPLSVPFSSAPSCHTELCWRDRQWGRGREGGGVEGGGEGRGEGTLWTPVPPAVCAQLMTGLRGAVVGEAGKLKQTPRPATPRLHVWLCLCAAIQNHPERRGGGRELGIW